jgi:hypothetical protein
MQLIKLIEASCALPCLLRRMGIIRGTTKLVNSLSKHSILKVTHEDLSPGGSCHTHYICNRTFRGNYTAQSVRVFFSQLFEENKTELAEELILAALFDDNGEAGGQIISLLTHFRTLVVKTPQKC